MNVTVRFVFLLTLVLALGAPIQAQIAFDDVAAASGISHNGASWGSAWGFYDDDIYPDLWVTNHNQPYTLFLNLGNGFFGNASVVSDANPVADMHGAAWADFDNDGDQDLMQSVGAQAGMGSGSNILLVNRNGALQDEAIARGVDYAGGRGRTPTWLDWNGDGRLDLVVANNQRPDGLFPSPLFTQQANGNFVDDSLTVGFDGSAPTFYAQTTGVRGHDTPLLLVHRPKYPQHVYQYDMSPFIESAQTVGLALQISGTAQDSTLADFDNNGETDLYLASQVDTSDVVLDGTNSFKAYLQVNASQRTIEIETDGDLQLAVTPEIYISPTDIYLGSTGVNPTGRFFVVSTTNPDHQGTKTHTAGTDFGLYIGYDTVAGRWTIQLSKSVWTGLDILATSTEDITAATAVDFVAFDGGQDDKIFSRSGGVFTNTTAASGIPSFTACSSVVSGDFDNDMDVDVYLGCRSMVGNNPNILLENQGDGTFVEVPGAGGAEGTTMGRGDVVTVADYDVDGFLDIFSVNGIGFGAFSPGPDQLFRNLGNANHWLEVDLEGVVNNRDGLGARVSVTAGGVTQVRETHGGVHRYGQDSGRVHFGLGSNTVVDTLEVQWPGGAQQSVQNLPADQLVRVVERSQPAFVGQPVYQPGVDRGVYLWKDTANGPWHLRASSDSSGSVFTIRLVSIAPLQSVTPVNIGGADFFGQTATSFVLNAIVSGGEDGVDFTLYQGAPALLSVSRNGVRNPKDLHVGPTGLPLSPKGWVTTYSALPSLPAFTTGEDLGLFIGRDTQTDEILARFNADANQHIATLLLASGGMLGTAVAVDTESGDNVISGPFSVFMQATATGDFDGFDVTANPNAQIGIAYWQDSLFQSHRVNPMTRELGLPNAYLLQ